MNLSLDVQRLNEATVKRVDYDGSSIGRPSDRLGRTWCAVHLDNDGQHIGIYVASVPDAAVARALAADLIAAAEIVEASHPEVAR